MLIAINEIFRVYSEFRRSDNKINEETARFFIISQSIKFRQRIYFGECHFEIEDIIKLCSKQRNKYKFKNSKVRNELQILAKYLEIPEIFKSGNKSELSQNILILCDILEINNDSNVETAHWSVS